MKITKELLIKKGACNKGIRWFEEHYPNGVSVTAKAILECKDCPTDFIWWLYNNVCKDDRLLKLCDVNGSDGVNGSNGVNRSDGVNWSFGILNSFGVDYALFLANKPRSYTIFGKEVSEERFNNVYSNLIDALNNWKPTFNNIKALYLKNGSDWVKTPIENAEEISKKEAWADMPKEAIEYIKSLPEFDADMFTEITGIEV